MAAEPQQSAISSAFPAPPPFYKAFTAENLQRLRDHIQSTSQSSEASAATNPPHTSQIDLTSLPSDLKSLIPPKLPEDGKYRSFGAGYDVSPASKSTQDVPTRATLVRLNDRLLQLFLRYVQILATDPSGRLWVPQWEEIRNTFEEAHGLINEYRPHQARETLILMMEDQIKQLKDETAQVKTSVAKAKELMKNLSGGGQESGNKNRDKNEDLRDRHDLSDGQMPGTSKNSTKQMWDILDTEVGKI